MSDADNRRELVSKLKALSARRGESWPELFAAYDHDHDGQIDADELEALLQAADVGNGFTRGAWATGILEHLDKDDSGGVSLAELNGVINSGAPAPPAANGSKAKPLTRAEARAIAQRAATSKGPMDLRAFSQADLALIEEENRKLTGTGLEVTTGKVATLPIDTSSDAWLWVLAGAAALALLWRR